MRQSAVNAGYLGLLCLVRTAPTLAAVLAVRLFGEVAVEVDGAAVALPGSRKAVALLAWLAVHPGPHPRSRLAAEFWPDVVDASARASLRSAVWALRSAGIALRADRDSVGLVDVRTDVGEFDRLVADGDVEAAERVSRGELLPRFDSDWVLRLRDEHEAKRADVLGALAERDPDRALDWARQRVALRPLDEAAVRALLRLLNAAGERSAALTAYTRFAHRLRADLGVAPAPETTLLAGEPAESSLPPEPAPHGLVGRDAELAELTAAWRRAERGSGATVVLSGDGGIGKSRLAEELLTVARAAGALTGVGVASGPVPYGPWAEALGDVVAARPAVLDRDRPWPAELARVVPGAQGRASGAGADRVRLFESVVELLARAGPLALLVEDLHLADASSLELTAHVGRRLTRLPVLLVLTRRDLPPRPGVDGVLAALRARGALAADLALGPLPDRLVRGLVGAVPDADRIVELAAGSPLIAVQMARAPATGAGLRGAVRHTVGTLSAPARLFTELLAVAGRDLAQAEIAALQVPDPTRAATEALGSGLLRVRGDAIGFRHALLSEAVYADLAEPLRARLHAEVADALRRRPRRQPAEIARHLRLAGQDRAAAACLITAAAHARTIAALAEAADFLAQAIDLDPDDPDPHVELAEVLAWRGLRAESDAAFARALELIPARDCGAQAAAWLRRGRWLRGVICDPRESRRSYRSALDADPDPHARAEALAGMAWAEATAGDPTAVDGLLAEIPDDLDDLLAHDVGVARGHVLLRAGRFVESYDPLVAAAAAAHRAGRPDMAYSCLINATTAAACAGEFDRALDFADRCLPLTLPNGLFRLAVHAHSARATLLRRVGRLAEARAACDQAAQLADRIGQSDLIGLVHHDRGLLAHAAGEWDAAAAELAAALAHPTPVSPASARLHLADALARGGHADAAEAELRAVALEPVAPSDFPDTLVARMSTVQGRIALLRGDRGLAATRLAEARRGWLRRVRRTTGAEYVAVLVDLGRPSISAVVEPERELAEVTALLDTLGRADAALR